MRKIVARFELTTPSFLGGMESTLSGFRGPSLRGVLRFWWRALMFSRFQQDLSALQEKESELFGSSAGGTGRVQFLPVQALTKPHPLSWDEVTNHRDGLTYLAYGINQRQALSAPIAFDLPLVIRHGGEDSVNEALILMGMLGGVGARSRRGWGSLSLQRIEEDGQRTWTAPTDAAGLETVWRGLARHEAGDMAHTALPPFTVLSPLTHIYLLETGSNALSILNHAGEEFQRYRSFGRNGKVAGRPAEQNFRTDHDLILNATQHITPTHAPERTIFGLPHNYWFSSTKGKASVTSSTQRRASPLFLHVQKLAANYAVVVGILPAVFVPDKSLKITTPSKSYSVPADVTSYYPRIEQFVTGTHPQDKLRRFPQEVSLWP